MDSFLNQIFIIADNLKKFNEFSSVSIMYITLKF
jgi:hypothetical protein